MSESIKSENKNPTNCPTCGQGLCLDFWNKTDEKSQRFHQSIFALIGKTSTEKKLDEDSEKKAAANKLLIEWRPEFNIGINTVDDQHQKISQLINMIHLSIKTNTRRPNFIPDLISDMDHYVKEHFSDEEKLMRDLGYPGLVEHQKQHGEFIEKVQHARHEFKEGFFNLNALLKFVVHWFMEHSQGTDRDFGNWAKTNNKIKESV